MPRRVRSVRDAHRAVVRRARQAWWLGSWHAILVAVGLLIAQGPMLAHLLLVRHVACEHGELVHEARYEALAADGSPGVDGGLTLGKPSSAPHTPGDAALPGSSDDRGHEHCDALAIRHRLVEAGVAVGPATLIDVALDAPLGEGGERRPIPLLSLAPKGSPPAV